MTTSPVSASHVFVVGCNRSGTSLLRHILNTSASLAIAPETHFLRRLSAVGVGRELERMGRPVTPASVDRFVDRVYSGGRTWGASYWLWLQRNVERETFREGVDTTDGSDRALFELLLQLYRQRTKPMGLRIVQGEKTPTHLYYVPTLLEWFPGARVIHILRDPRAILASKLRKGRVRRREGVRARLAVVPAKILDPLVDPIDIVHTTKAWFDAARLHDEYAARYPVAYRMIRFEDLVSDPEPTLRALCAFIGVDYEATMLEEVPIVGSSYSAAHRMPGGLDERLIRRWRQELNPIVRRSVEVIAGRQLRRFGYLS